MASSTTSSGQSRARSWRALSVALVTFFACSAQPQFAAAQQQMPFYGSPNGQFAQGGPGGYNGFSGYSQPNGFSGQNGYPAQYGQGGYNAPNGYGGPGGYPQAGQNGYSAPNNFVPQNGQSGFPAPGGQNGYMAPGDQSSAQGASGGKIDKWHAPLISQGTGIPPLNVGVINFAVENLGNKVGNGECWTLAEQALIKSGAARPQGYVFGRELMPNEPWQPGDVIQFTTCTFVEVTPRRRTTFTMGEPNHTAIIHSINGGQVLILEQNVNRDKHVQTQLLNFNNMTGGNIKVYQPIPSGFNFMPQQQDPSSKKKKHHKHHEDES